MSGGCSSGRRNWKDCWSRRDSSSRSFAALSRNVTSPDWSASSGDGRRANRLQGARAKLQAGRKPGYEDSRHGLRRETGAVIRVRTLRARAATWHLLPPCTPSTSSCLTSTVAYATLATGGTAPIGVPRTHLHAHAGVLPRVRGGAIEFSRGLAEPDDPALTVRDLTGAVKVWIEIGAPNAERLHRATRAARGSWCTPTRNRRSSCGSSRDRGSIVPTRSSCTRSTASSCGARTTSRTSGGVQPVSHRAAAVSDDQWCTVGD